MEKKRGDVMFKSDEDIKKEVEENNWKIKDHIVRERDYLAGVGDGIMAAFRSIAERKEFYRKYKEYSIPAFIEECPQFTDALLAHMRKIIGLGDLTAGLLLRYQPEFRDWLLDFCFEGIN
jgi:hypothetical protein